MNLKLIFNIISILFLLMGLVGTGLVKYFRMTRSGFNSEAKNAMLKMHYTGSLFLVLASVILVLNN